MWRYLVSLIILVHGFLHLIGFVNAFGIAKVESLSRPVSKLTGLAWLLAAVLLVTVAILYLARINYWWVVAIPAVLVSQCLLVLYWKDARFGTIANVMVALVTITAMAASRFDASTAAIVQSIDRLPQVLFDKPAGQSDTLPLSVQRWLRASGSLGRRPRSLVKLEQSGWMRMKPEDSSWIPVHAIQHFNFDQPSFVWAVDMKMNGMPVKGRDVFRAGRGRMLISAIGLINLVDQSGPKIDQGSLQRFLSEICWNPDAALQPYIQWQAMDESTARATMTYAGTTGSVDFQFDNMGRLLLVKAMRYKGGDEEATLQRWQVRCTAHDRKTGIPMQAEATWKLPDGDFTWFKLKIESIEYH